MGNTSRYKPRYKQGADRTKGGGFTQIGRYAVDEVEAAFILTKRQKRRRGGIAGTDKDQRRKQKPSITLAQMPWDDKEN